MKSLLFLVGAFLGVVLLPALNVLSIFVYLCLSERSTSFVSLASLGRGYVTVFHDSGIIPCGAIFGALSTGWLLGKRTPLFRATNVVLGLASSGLYLWILYTYPSISNVGIGVRLVQLSLCLPIISWGLALFFFGLLARSRPLVQAPQ